MAAADPLLVDRNAAAGIVIGDKAYDALRLRSALIEKGSRPVVPYRATAKAPEPLDHALHAERNLIERAFNRLKDDRRIATRFDKLARNFAAAVALTALRIWYLI